MAVRIFKLISGEMMIGNLVDIYPLDVEDQAKENNLELGDFLTTAVLHTDYNLVFENTMLLAYNQQGFGIMPTYPWCNPKERNLSIINGQNIMLEADMTESCHTPIVSDYNQVCSKIELPKKGTVLNLV